MSKRIERAERVEDVQERVPPVKTGMPLEERLLRLEEQMQRVNKFIGWDLYEPSELLDPHVKPYFNDDLSLDELLKAVGVRVTKGRRRGRAVQEAIRRAKMAEEIKGRKAQPKSMRGAGGRLRPCST